MPKGLPRRAHFDAAAAATSPLEKQPTIPDDLLFACRAIATHGKDVGKWRRKQFRTLKRHMHSANSLREVFEGLREPASAKVSGHLRADRFDVAGHSIKWPDTDFWALLLRGGQIVGDLPKTNIC